MISSGNLPDLHRACSTLAKKSPAKKAFQVFGCLAHTHILDVGKLGLFCSVLAQHFVCLEIHIDPRVSQPHQDVVQTHKQAAQQQHALVVNSQLSAVQRNAVIIELALVQNDLVEEENRITPFQQLNGNLLLRRRKGGSAVDSASICRGVTPVIGLNDLLDVLSRLLARALPVAGVGDAQHVLISLVDGVEGVGGVEV